MASREVALFFCRKGLHLHNTFLKTTSMLVIKKLNPLKLPSFTCILSKFPHTKHTVSVKRKRGKQRADCGTGFYKLIVLLCSDGISKVYGLGSVYKENGLCKYVGKCVYGVWSSGSRSRCHLTRLFINNVAFHHSKYGRKQREDRSNGAAVYIYIQADDVK